MINIMEGKKSIKEKTEWDFKIIELPVSIAIVRC